MYIYETVANLQLICELIDFPDATNNLPHCSTDELDIFTNNIQLDICTEDTMNFLYRSDRSMELPPEQNYQVYKHHQHTTYIARESETSRRAYHPLIVYCTVLFSYNSDNYGIHIYVLECT